MSDVLVIARSYCPGLIASVSVAALSSGVGGVTVSGPIVTVLLVVVPAAEAGGWSTAVTVKVTVPPVRRETRTLSMLPVPLDVATLEPAEAAAVQAALTNPVRLSRVVSLTGTSTAVLGPALLATIV